MRTLTLLWFGAQIAVIAHRGEHLAHPENTLPAFQAAIDAGADYFELDVRTTSDGRLVLMHDRTVDRTTNGTGLVHEMTFAQIRSLDAGTKFNPKFAGTAPPSFEEALLLARGKIGVYVDCKDLTAADLVAALARTNMLDQVVIYGDQVLLKSVASLKPGLRVMPEAENAAALTSLMKDLHPRVVAFDAHDFTADIIAVAKSNRADIFVDRLWTADTLPDWIDAIQRGATGIQTDHPAELVTYLRSHGLHK